MRGIQKTEELKECDFYLLNARLKRLFYQYYPNAKGNEVDFWPNRDISYV